MEGLIPTLRIRSNPGRGTLGRPAWPTAFPAQAWQLGLRAGDGGASSPSPYLVPGPPEHWRSAATQCPPLPPRTAGTSRRNSGPARPGPAPSSSGQSRGTARSSPEPSLPEGSSPPTWGQAEPGQRLLPQPRSRPQEVKAS